MKVFLYMLTTLLVLTGCRRNQAEGDETVAALYRQGRAYHEKGEVPQALECYRRAAEQADTTWDCPVLCDVFAGKRSKDCDWAMLARCYYQMSSLFSDQNAPRQMLSYLQKAEHCAWLAADTLMAIDIFSLRAAAYELMNRQDSVLIINEKAIALLHRFGMDAEAAIVEGYRFATLVELKRFDEASAPMQVYEHESGLFHNGDIEAGREIYYYSKGLYFIGIGRADSAEYYFRKELRLTDDDNNRLAAVRGLSLAFQAQGRADSTAKYAMESYELNDSLTNLTNTESLMQAHAMYDYDRMLRDSERKALQVEVSWLIICLLLMSLAGAVVLIVFGYRRYSDYRERLLIRNAGDRLKLLTESDLVRSFAEMASGKRGSRLPEQAEWDRLEAMVAEQLPPFYAAIASDGLLSPQELRTTLLTLLGFTSSDVAVLLDISAQSATNTKARANGKLTGQKNAGTFCANLLRLLRKCDLAR